MMMLTTIAAALFGADSAHALKANAPAYCRIGTSTRVVLPEGNYGMYNRVHPTGDYVLFSGYPAKILDLRGRDGDKIRPRLIETAANQEAYPTEGNWDYIASPNHGTAGDTMNFYRFTDLVNQGTGARPAEVQFTGESAPREFTDSGHNQYYHSAAELPGATETNKGYRVALWSKRTFRDYSVNRSTTPPTVTQGTVRQLCGNMNDQNLSNPILSKDGQEIAFNGGSPETTRVYRMDSQGNCTLDVDLGFRTGKVSFSYPENGKKGRLAFSAASNVGVNGTSGGAFSSLVFVYDRDTRAVTRLSEPGVSRSYTASYPGFTRDGRVIFQETRTNDYNSPGTTSLIIAQPSTYDSFISGQDGSGHECFSGDQQLYGRTLGAIGRLWYDICGSTETTTEADFRSRGLSLNPARCEQMVRDKFEDWRQENPNSDIRLEHFLAACSRTPNSAPAPAASPAATALTAQGVFGQKCAMCHGPTTQYPLDLSAARLNSPVRASSSASGTTLRQEILRRLQATGAEAMPPGNPLNAAEKAALRGGL
jgi:mono/diheme cytochrome c family protein